MVRYPLSTLPHPFVFTVLLLPVLSLLASARGSSPPLSADFIVVGAGTAGCALVARLCVLLPSQHFILVERAKPRNKAEELLVRSPRQMWNAWEPGSTVIELFGSLPNPGLNNRSIDIFTGATFGGSSAIDGMQWVVPVEGTVEKWGIHGLDTNTSKRFYERAFSQVGFMAQRGALRHMYAAGWVEAAEKAGYMKGNDPFNDAESLEVFENRIAVDNKGARVDSCTAYLTPVQDTACKNNLEVVQDATVTRILFRQSQPTRAVGVEYVKSGDIKLKNARKLIAKKEVIISAGPFGSPKLLQLSGIGPPDVLKRAGVPLRVALPVGRRTQSRNFVSIASVYTGVPLEPSNNSTLLNSPKSLIEFTEGKGGVLGIASFFGNGRDKKDAYLTGTGSFFQAAVDAPVLSSNCNGNVKSFGFLQIRDADPFLAPEIQLALLSKERDVRRLARCLNRLVEVHKQFPQEWNASISDPPGGFVTEDWIRSNAGWAGHYVGGCKVGNVVDEKLKVKKTKGIRVVDSSVLGTVPISAGPMGSTYMLAEYMAEVIAEAY